jgi:Domain of Unknown Function (DUF326)
VTVQEMIKAHRTPTSVDREALLRCIDDCFDCSAACTSCADLCLGEDDLQDLVRCIRVCLDCADACDAAGRIVTRQTEPDFSVIRAMLEACAVACRVCGEACTRHADRHEHCRVCAGTCTRCEQACNDLLATIE